MEKIDETGGMTLERALELVRALGTGSQRGGEPAHIRKHEAVPIMRVLVSEIDRLRTALSAERGARDELSFDNSELRTENDALRARLGVARAALGFDDETRLGNKHARYNLEGAIHDLKAGANDKICHRTLDRVAQQLAEAETALKDKDTHHDDD